MYTRKPHNVYVSSKTNMVVIEFYFINKDVVMSVMFVLNDNIFHCYVFLSNMLLLTSQDKPK